MELMILGSGSKGNCYLLKARTGEILMLECGVDIKEIKKGIEFNVDKVVGVLVTHEHLDHCKSMKKVAELGMDVYASSGTFDKRWCFGHRYKRIKSMNQFTIGSFTILPFDIKHDAQEPLGFIIHHAECGNVVFITDSYILDYKFPGLNTVIVEANYSDELIGTNPSFLRDRIMKSHMSIATCKKWLGLNELSTVRNVVLAHLSDRNSHAVDFQTEIEKSTGKKVYVADAGMSINISLNPF